MSLVFGIQECGELDKDEKEKLNTNHNSRPQIEMMKLLIKDHCGPT